MKFKLFIILIIGSLCFASCEKKTSKSEKLINIKVNLENKPATGKFDDYFSASTIIPLETNKESMIAGIDRISIYNDIFFILDRKSKSVLAFDKNGKFLNKIHSIGKGPQEYIQLTDFTIDKKNKHLILYSDVPYKFLTYSIDGKFVREKSINNLYMNIGSENGKMLLLNGDSRDFMFSEIGLENDAKISFSPLNYKDKLFKDFGVGSPNIIKDTTIHVSFPYSDTIYQYDKNNIKPKYFIDFGKRRISEDIYRKEKDFIKLYTYANSNNYGFAIANFRENKDYITFSFGGTNIAIYSKQSKKTRVFSSIENPENKIDFYNYFAHDGNDNSIISIHEAASLKNNFMFYKTRKKDVWEKLPESTKQVVEKITELDNPILVVNTFKDINKQ